MLYEDGGHMTVPRNNFELNLSAQRAVEFLFNIVHFTTDNDVATSKAATQFLLRIYKLLT